MINLYIGRFSNLHG